MNTLILLIASGVGSPPASPLHCPTPLAAKGEVKGGPPLVHVFELTNRGTGVLTITKVEGGCGCVRQTLSTSVLAAGGTAKLAIEVNTLTQPNGPNRWQVAVAYKVEPSGAPIQTGELLLQITANLTCEVIITPAQLGFSTAGAASQVVTINDTRSKKLIVLKAMTSNPHLVAEVSAPEAGKGQCVTVKLSPDAPLGERDETLVLSTDDSAYPELRIPVRLQKLRGRGHPHRAGIGLASIRCRASRAIDSRAIPDRRRQACRDRKCRKRTAGRRSEGITRRGCCCRGAGDRDRGGREAIREVSGSGEAGSASRSGNRDSRGLDASDEVEGKRTTI